MSATYPTLKEVRKSRPPHWYRCSIDKDRLRELSRRDDRKGWIQAGGHLGLFIFTGVVCWICWSEQLWILFAVALWFHGMVASFFSGVAPHELGHGTVFRTSKLNRLFLYLFSIISWWNPFDYAASHTYHHRYTTYVDGDRENLLPLQPSLHPWLVFQLLTINLFSKPGRNFGKGGLLWAIYLTARSALGLNAGHTNIASQEWLQTLHADQPDVAQQSTHWSRLLLLFHGVVVAISLVTDNWVLVLLITVPSFIASWGTYATGMPQHCGLQQDVPDFRKNTRSMKLNPILEFLYWRMNWHIEHHMFAGVPCYNLKQLAHEIADDMPQPRTLVSAWQEMRDIWRRQQVDPTYQFNTTLPVNAEHTTSDPTDEMASSIGDLAPVGLKKAR